MVSAGDHIVADKCVYGSVYTLFDEVLTRLGSKWILLTVLNLSRLRKRKAQY